MKEYLLNVWWGFTHPGQVLRFEVGRLLGRLGV